jgi:hypothetical protein
VSPLSFFIHSIHGFRKISKMSFILKTATLAVGVACLIGAGPANAADCDGSIQHLHNGRTIQCYYLPTVSNGRISGLQKEVNYGGSFNSPYGGATIGRWPGPHRPH